MNITVVCDVLGEANNGTTIAALNLIRSMRERGHTVRVVCADRDTPHTLEDTEIRFPVFLVVGGERRGISRALLDRADLKVKISYAREFRAALSAASAATILAYEIFRQNRK